MMLLRPEIREALTKAYPVIKKRTAVWFFSQDKSSGKKVNKLNSKKLHDQWISLDPEEKIKYYKMAKFDEIRFKEQRQLWIAEVSSILSKEGQDVKKLAESLSQVESKQRKLVESLEKYRSLYEKTIELDCAKKYIKDMIAETKNTHHKLSEEQIMSVVSEGCRSIMSQPRKPVNSFVIFRQENRERILELQRENPHLTVPEIAGQEWAKLSQEERAKYDEEYDRLANEYQKAIARFKDSSGEYFEQAAKEKRTFSKSLRKRLRGYETIPVGIRNPFNFFVMHNKDAPISEQIKLWRLFSDKDKEIYRAMAREDSVRYYKEREIYDKFVKSLNNLFSATK